MSDARDLVLEHALRELHAPRPRDLSDAIRQALERGERGSLSPDEVRACESAASEEELVPLAPSARPAVPVLTLAAAALFLLATGALLWFIATRGVERRPVPSVSVPEGAGAGPLDGAPRAAEGDAGAGAVEVAGEGTASAGEARRFEQLVATVLGDFGDVKTAPGLPRPMANPVGRYRDLALVSSELSGVLERRPDLWREFQSRLRGGAGLDPKKAMMALDFLHRDPSARSLELARELWLERPEVFEEIHIVGFAERGAFEFAREVEALVASFEPATVPPPVIAAAHLAFRGDRSGFEILESSLDALKPGALDRYLLAACALDSSGDPTAWSRATETVCEEVERRLEGSELMLASEIALGLEFFAREREAIAESRLDLLGIRALEHVERRRNEVQSEGEIRAVLEALPR